MFENRKLSTRVYIKIFSLLVFVLKIFLIKKSKVHLQTRNCNNNNKQTPLYCIDKIYVQVGHELLRIEGMQMLFYYSNYETKVEDQPVFWENGNKGVKFDQFEIKKFFFIYEVM